MNHEHPINPPSELMQQWVLDASSVYSPPGTCPNARKIAIQAARWGADQELEACCKWLTKRTTSQGDANALRFDRRSKPPSLKQQASESLDAVVEYLKMLVPGASVDGVHIETIRRALESIPDTEA